MSTHDAAQLHQPPNEDDTVELDEGDFDFLPAPRRRRLPVLTATLFLLLAIGTGAVAGIAAQKHWGAASTPGGSFGAGQLAAGANLGRAGGANGGAAAGGATTGLPDRTVGSVKAIDGTSLYITDTNGNVIKITTDAASAVSVTKASALKDIKPGDNVVVQGTKTSTGYKATSISVGGAAAGGGFGDRGGGFGGDQGAPTGFGGGG